MISTRKASGGPPKYAKTRHVNANKLPSNAQIASHTPAVATVIYGDLRWEAES
jgi:hypothetical protein